MPTYGHIAWASTLFIVVVSLAGVFVTGNLVVGVCILAAPIPLQLVRLIDREDLAPGEDRRQRLTDEGVDADLDRRLRPSRPQEMGEPPPALFLPDCPALDPSTRAPSVTIRRLERPHASSRTPSRTRALPDSIAMRFLLLLPLLALAACDAPRPASAEEREAAYEAALRDGDGDRALNLLEDAAATGELRALGALAEALHQGYIPGVNHDGEPITPNVALRTWPGQATITRWRFERVRDDSARAGHPLALFLVANELLRPDHTGDGWEGPTAAERDSAAAIYERLVASESPSLQLAFLAKDTGRADEYIRLLAAAATTDPQACAFFLWTRGPAFRYDAAALSAAIDDAEVCRALPATHGDLPWDYGARTMDQLATQIDAGNGEAVALVDSLRVLGVFERHPRLTALLPDA